MSIGSAQGACCCVGVSEGGRRESGQSLWCRRQDCQHRVVVVYACITCAFCVTVLCAPLVSVWCYLFTQPWPSRCLQLSSTQCGSKLVVISCSTYVLGPWCLICWCLGQASGVSLRMFHTWDCGAHLAVATQPIKSSHSRRQLKLIISHVSANPTLHTRLLCGQ